MAWYLGVTALVSAAAFIAALPVSGGPKRTAPPIIDLGYAKYQGVSLDAGVDQYLGIRYAAPPLGDLRWRAPQDPQPQSDIQDASRHGPVCLGQAGLPFALAGDSEDCLMLDVYSPTNATPDSKLPVWFFIPGGGYAVNLNVGTNGTEVIAQSDHGIVFVYVNYRVGVYGFLASEEIRQNGDLNVGLLDQRKALEWVQKYISLFGGDPDHVIIHGASAGAGSVALHMTAFGGRDDHLFSGGIVQSAFWPTLLAVKDVEFKYTSFAANVSCGNAENVLGCLRSKDTSTLQMANVAIPFPGSPGIPIWQFLPVVDGIFIQDQLYNLFDQGQVIHVPALIGNDNNEGTYFAPNATTSEEYLDFMQSNYPALGEVDLQWINSTYPLMSSVNMHAAWFPSAAAAYGEATLNCPGNEIAVAVAQNVGPDFVWNYHTDIIDQQYMALGLGVPHTIESLAIFGPNQGGACDDCSFETYNAPIVPVVMDYFISFVKTLNPNPLAAQQAPAWEPWGKRGAQGQRIRFQTNNTAMETVSADQVERCRFWKRLAPVMRQ